MGQIGIDLVIKTIGGSAESIDAITGAFGKTIAALALGDDDALHFEFSDGTKIRIADEGQYCCEKRYMRTDDNLSEFIGSKIIGIEIKEAPSVPDEDGDHDVQFLEIKTDIGVFTMAIHNEHNGSYGGFDVYCTVE